MLGSEADGLKRQAESAAFIGMAEAAFDTLAVTRQLKAKSFDSDQGPRRSPRPCGPG